MIWRRLRRIARASQSATEPATAEAESNVSEVATVVNSVEDQTIKKWLKNGDRSHPNLKLIDEELPSQLTYEGCGKDIEKLEGLHLKGRVGEFDGFLQYMKHMQKQHEGVRSDPHLVALDSLAKRLTYDGWREDFDDASKHFMESGRLMSFDRRVEKMKRKQAISEGDYSHKDLQYIQSLELSFPGWQKEVTKAFDQHREGWHVEYFRSSLPERQRMSEGDRSHPRLLALDSMKLTYPGWEEDVKEAEKEHIENKIWFGNGLYPTYKAFLGNVSSKQELYVSDPSTPWLHPMQKQILEMTWTYPCWQADMKIVRQLKYSHPVHELTLTKLLGVSKLRQMSHGGNFSEHPALKELHELQLSYPDWEIDFEAAKRELLKLGYNGWQYTFGCAIRGMRNKQQIYDGIEDEDKEVETSSFDQRTQKVHLGTCVICLESPRTHVFIPCGHACACEACSRKVMNKKAKCPICNYKSKGAMQLFFS
ncbi:hypothetical protein ACHAWF_006950 [Thalassiosira exigua]